MKEACGQLHARYPAGRVDGEKRVEKNFSQGVESSDLSPHQKETMAVVQGEPRPKGQGASGRRTGTALGVQVAEGRAYTSSMATA